MQWQRVVDGELSVAGFAVDAAGNAFVTGPFSGSVDFDPGAGVKTLSAGSATAAFVLKLDAAGAFKAASMFGGAGATIQVSGVVLDGADDAVLSGTFSGTVDFNPGPAITSLTARGTSDAFVAKLTPTAALAWVARVGGTAATVQPTGVTVGADGSIYCTGTMSGPVNDVVFFDPGLTGTTGSSKTIKGTTDAFAMKLSPDGRLAWAGQFAGAGLAVTPIGIAVAPDGTVYTAGNITGTAGQSADFDPGPGVATITKSIGQSDEFICAIKPDGSLARTRSFRAVGSEADIATASAITIDTAGNAYVAGYGTGHVTSGSGFDDFIDDSGDAPPPKFIYLTTLAAGGATHTSELTRGFMPGVTIFAPIFSPNGAFLYVRIDANYIFSGDSRLIRVAI